jgi:hypothetical protein
VFVVAQPIKIKMVFRVKIMVRQAQWDEPIIFSLGRKGRRGSSLSQAEEEIAKLAVNATEGLPRAIRRTQLPKLPELSEVEVVRHFTSHRLESEDVGDSVTKAISQWVANHEQSCLDRIKSKTRDFLKDAGLGWKMYRRGKIKLLPSKLGGGKEIEEIFNAFEKGKR